MTIDVARASKGTNLAELSPVTNRANDCTARHGSVPSSRLQRIRGDEQNESGAHGSSQVLDARIEEQMIPRSPLTSKTSNGSFIYRHKRTIDGYQDDPKRLSSITVTSPTSQKTKSTGIFAGIRDFLSVKEPSIEGFNHFKANEARRVHAAPNDPDLATKLHISNRKIPAEAFKNSGRPIKTRSIGSAEDIGNFLTSNRQSFANVLLAKDFSIDREKNSSLATFSTSTSGSSSASINTDLTSFPPTPSDVTGSRGFFKKISARPGSKNKGKHDENN